MQYEIKWKKLCISVLIALSVGLLTVFLTHHHMQIYRIINKPVFSPPATLFPIIWIILYVLMGISAYLIYMSNDYMKTSTLYMYATQLMVHFGWPILFFNFNQYFLSFLILLLLWIMVVIMIAAFSSINKLSAWIQIPYIIWLTFTLYLNAGICILNI